MYLNINNNNQNIENITNISSIYEKNIYCGFKSLRHLMLIMIILLYIVLNKKIYSFFLEYSKLVDEGNFSFC